MQSGFVSFTSVAGKCRRLISDERVEEAKREAMPPCAMLSGPGVCTARHELWMIDVLELDSAFWRWTVPSLTPTGLEGSFCVCFTVVKSDGYAAPESAECSYYTISRRHGNPRRVILTQWASEHDRPELPCELPLQEVTAKSHATGHGVALRLLQTLGAFRVMVARADVHDRSLRRATAVNVGDECAIWPQAAVQAKTRRVAIWPQAAVQAKTRRVAAKYGLDHLAALESKAATKRRAPVAKTGAKFPTPSRKFVQAACRKWAREVFDGKWQRGIGKTERRRR